MNASAREITDMLQRKAELDRDRAGSNNLVSYTSWITDAIELLLRIELGRQRRG